jgi:SAM-dependent methyltransferase
LRTEEDLTRERAQTGGGYRWVAQDCPVCGVPPSKYLGRRGGSAHRMGLGVECRVWRCGGCGIIFPNPMPMPLGGVEQHYALDPTSYFRQHDAELKLAGASRSLEYAAQIAGGRGRLLDIGAGRGEMLAAARALGWEAVGVEPSPSFAEYAERLSGAEVRREPVERCGFEPESFDAVILGSVLEHLYNPDETMGEIARLLRRGGALYVDVPNEAGLYFRLGNLYQRLRGRDWVVNIAPTFEPFHVFGFCPRALRALLAKHGLRVYEWSVYAGHSALPDRGGLAGAVEQLGARAVTALSRVGQLGTYISAWALKS